MDESQQAKVKTLPKTFVLLISTNQRVHAQRAKLIADDRLIEQVSTTKYLGVKIDSRLSWKQHTDSCLKPVTNYVFAIRRMTPLSQNVTETLYKSLWSLWCGTVKLVDKLERVHKLAARTVLGTPSIVRTVGFYKTLNWSKLNQCMRYHIATYVFKVLNGLSSPYLQNTSELSVDAACIKATTFTFLL